MNALAGCQAALVGEGFEDDPACPDRDRPILAAVIPTQLFDE